jgi:tetratricopeptide (TPR) repeat protein
VQQQRRGDWEDAATSLQRALDLNPNNASAKINLAYNEARRSGKPQTDEAQKLIEDFFHHVQDVLNAYGTIDEPTLQFEQGRAFLQGRMLRQGLIYMTRVAELEPNNYSARVVLADIYTSLDRPKQAFEIINHVRANAAAFNLNVTNEFELARCEASALFRDKQQDGAAKLLREMLKKPAAPKLFKVAASQLYLQNNMHAEAVPVLDDLLTSEPDEVMALANRGFALLQLKRDNEAVTSLSRAIELDPKNIVARVNRGLALNRTKQFDLALEDWELVVKEYPNSYQILAGLAEASAGKGDLTRASELYEKAARLAPAGSPDQKDITQRLEALKAPRK